jgi:hypothetical protein
MPGSGDAAADVCGGPAGTGAGARSASGVAAGTGEASRGVIHADLAQVNHFLAETVGNEEACVI